MTINKEVEAKALLTKNDYERIVNYFSLAKEKQFKQINYYFDTDDMMFQSHKIAFRIRHLQKEDKYEMTAKLRQKDGSSIELNQYISYRDFVITLSCGNLPDGEVKERLNLLIKDKKVNHIATLATFRYELKYDDGLLAIDENHYSNIIDYELEFEGETMAQCVTSIKNLLHEIGIDYIVNKMGKRARAFRAAQALKNKNI